MIKIALDTRSGQAYAQTASHMRHYGDHYQRDGKISSSIAESTVNQVSSTKQAFVFSQIEIETKITPKLSNLDSLRSCETLYVIIAYVC